METLSDKIGGIMVGLPQGMIPVPDVKEFIKNWIGSLIPDDKPIDCINKLKKLAGDKLT